MSKARAKPARKKPARKRPAAKKEAPTSAFDDMVEGEGDRPEGESAGGALALYNMSQPEFESTDVMMPFLRLAQGLSREVQDGVARPGEWLLQGFEPAEELTIIPLAFARQRELRDEDTREVLCRSQDSITGIGEPGGECAACPLSKWQERARGSNLPPECSFFYGYMVYVYEHDTLAAMRFQRTSLKSGKMLNTIVAQRGLGKVAVAINSDNVSGKKGTYSIPTINAVAVDDDVFEAAKDKLAAI